MLAIKDNVTPQAEPVWEVARLFPTQGNWSEEEYLALDTNHLVEFAQGQVEVLAMPSELHQDVVIVLFELLKQFAKRHNLGKVIIAPLPVQLWAGKFREPDILFMRAEHSFRRLGRHWIGADLVMEVVSPDDRRRDVETKRREYAQAGIPEYWIVDPERRIITVLTLHEQSYNVHGEFAPGHMATSILLPGFQVVVNEVFAVVNE